MQVKRRLRFWRRKPSEAAIADEAAAFLTGTSALCMKRRGASTPPWAWLNVLAHGSTSQILDVADGWSFDLPRGYRSRAWRQALRLIATEMMTCSNGQRDSISGIQTEVLQPLEARLMNNPSTAGMGPAQLVAATLVAMTHPSRSERHNT